jgi:hypothetical protein
VLQAGLQAPLQMVRVVVRIGVATGPLPHGLDVTNCAVKDRAKGGQCRWVWSHAGAVNTAAAAVPSISAD